MRHPHALIERDLFTSRAFTGASVALLLYFVGFAIFLLSVVLFLQGEWHYSAVRAGLAIAPGPAMSALFAINAGRIRARFGRVLPAVAGTLLHGGRGRVLDAVHRRDAGLRGRAAAGHAGGGMSAGLTQAPLFAAAGTLPPNRATTGSAVLTMARQVGSAIGVAVVVVILGTAAVHPLGAFHHVWLAEAIAGLAACLAVVVTAGRGPRAPPTSRRGSRRGSSTRVHVVQADRPERGDLGDVLAGLGPVEVRRFRPGARRRRRAGTPGACPGRTPRPGRCRRRRR